MGKLDTTSKNTVERQDSSLPITMSAGVILVVRRRFSVCLSLSPLTLPAVRAGTISKSMANSMAAPKIYRLRKLEYWISAVAFSWVTMEYMFKSATRARRLLQLKMIRGSLKDLALTRLSWRYTGLIFMDQHLPFLFVAGDLHEHRLQVSPLSHKAAQLDSPVNKLL